MRDFHWSHLSLFLLSFFWLRDLNLKLFLLNIDQSGVLLSHLLLTNNNFRYSIRFHLILKNDRGLLRHVALRLLLKSNFWLLVSHFLLLIGDLLVLLQWRLLLN